MTSISSPFGVAINVKITHSGDNSKAWQYSINSITSSRLSPVSTFPINE
ncbi:hypothetical protein [Moraxella nonliquefaciens]|nr:hypothetical protein [Moraxella nonliquefaciens]